MFLGKSKERLKEWKNVEIIMFSMIFVIKN